MKTLTRTGNTTTGTLVEQTTDLLRVPTRSLLENGHASATRPPVDAPAVCHDLLSRLMLDKWTPDAEVDDNDPSTIVAQMIHEGLDMCGDTARVHRQCYMRPATASWYAAGFVNALGADDFRAIDNALEELQKSDTDSEVVDDAVHQVHRRVLDHVQKAADDEEDYRAALYSVFGYDTGNAILDDQAADTALRSLSLETDLVKFLEKIGQYRESLSAARSAKQRKGDRGELSGVRPGRNVRNLLPAEKAMLVFQPTQLYQLDRLMKAQTMTYEHVERVPSKNGAVAIMLDTSGSMMGKPLSDAKALAIALMLELQRQNRRCTLTQFSHEASHVPVDLSTVEAKADTIATVAKILAEGGTNFDEAMFVAAEHSEPTDDWLLITDGQGAFEPGLHNLNQRRLAYIVLGHENQVVPALHSAATWCHVVNDLDNAVDATAELLV